MSNLITCSRLIGGKCENKSVPCCKETKDHKNDSNKPDVSMALLRDSLFQKLIYCGIPLRGDSLSSSHVAGVTTLKEDIPSWVTPEQWVTPGQWVTLSSSLPLWMVAWTMRFMAQLFRTKCISFFFSFFFGFSSPPGIKPVPPAMEEQSLNHWTARKVAAVHFWLHLPL